MACVETAASRTPPGAFPSGTRRPFLVDRKGDQGVTTANLESDSRTVPSEHEPGREQGPTLQIVSFRLANETYGVDIHHVQEIILIGRITEMPQVPPYVRGLINLRGNVIPVLDLRVRFGLPVAEQTDDSRIIVLNVDGKTMGVMVDAVEEVLRIQSAQIDTAPPGMAGVGKEYVRGLVNVNDHLLILLDVEKVFAGGTGTDADET
ncbi:MAG: chemotaxis protein CheW [Planctomycetota bacterium]|nr:MAG: chemotaxis protein CheW [Planctomycetota bacterium]